MLYCTACKILSSANLGDYTELHGDHIFEHCGRQMRLVIRQPTIVEVEIERR